MKRYKMYCTQVGCAMQPDPEGDYVHADEAEAEITRLREALRWYERRVSDCNRGARDGDEARAALEKDIGAKARAALEGVDDGGHWYSQASMDAVVRERDEYREALEGMRDLWAREWDHEGGSTIPVEVERMFAALEEVDHD